MTDKLKPCPFCGGSASLCMTEKPFPWVAKCKNCGAAAGGSAFQNDKWNACCWNTRADLPATDEQVMRNEKVKAMVKALKEVVEEYDGPDSGRYLRWAVDECRDV